MQLEKEIAVFEKLKPQLLEHHLGKFALIIGESVVGVYDSPQTAYVAGLAAHGNVPMLIKIITEHEGVETIPALVLGLYAVH